MKWISRAAVTALCTVGLLTVVVAARGAAPAQVASVKLAFVVSADIIPQHPDFAAAKAKLDAEVAALQKRQTVMSDSMTALIAAYQKEEATLTAAVRATREAALNAKSDAFNAEAQQREDSLARHQEDLITPMQDLLRTVLADIRNEDGYSFIFDASSSNGFIAAVDRNLDISSKVTTRFIAAAKAMPRPAGLGAAIPSPSGASAQPVGAGRTP